MSSTLELKRPDLLREACYIDGQWVKGSASFPVVNPATGQVIASVPMLGRQETEQAIASAKTAQGPWAAKTAKERAAVMLKWAQLMMANQQDLAAIMTAEQGKPLAEAA